MAYPGELEGRSTPAPNTVQGTLTRWKRVAVITGGERGGEKTYRLFILEPGGEEQTLEHAGFYVRGRFTVTQKINRTQEAQEAWKAFEPA